MRNFNDHLIPMQAKLNTALARLDLLAPDAILFVVDEAKKLIGSLTDGDVRRGLLNGRSLQDCVMDFTQPKPKSVSKNNYTLEEIISLRQQKFKILPVLDEESRVINIINFRFQHSYLPLDTIVMAGGRGLRLSPMTDTLPKPLLKVGGKAIIDHNIDRLRSFGIDDFHISLRYLGTSIVEHYRERNIQGTNMSFIWEDEPLGTLGAASLIDHFQHDYVLITNSDILTTLNYEDFFLDFIEKDADMSVATIPYQVDIPYAVMETNDSNVVSFSEKPTFTYYSNGGIYLVKRAILNRIPRNTFYNATDLMEDLINTGGKLVSYPIRNYWLDIGKPKDFDKAQEDIKHLDI